MMANVTIQTTIPATNLAGGASFFFSFSKLAHVDMERADKAIRAPMTTTKNNGLYTFGGSILFFCYGRNFIFFMCYFV